MKQHHTRYGYILTDRQFVAIKRLDRSGNLQVATPVPWTAVTRDCQARMTVLLGLWYSDMLVSEVEGGRPRWCLDWTPDNSQQT
jgi:hypothetical protein